MAEDYSNLGLIEGDKMIADLTKQIERLNRDLERGFRNVMVAGTQQNIPLNVFSEERQAVIDERDALEQQVTDISNALKVKAKA